MRVACCREFMNSLEQSSKRAIEIAITEAGLSDAYIILKNKIICRITGSEFFFVGFERSRESMRSWEDVDIVWVEEAHRMSSETHRLLYPSVRKPGSEIWFSFNPMLRSDPVWQDFCSAHPIEGALIVKVNYDQNPWFPEVLENERLLYKERWPEMYAHVWLGETMDDGSTRKVLPYNLLEMCIEAYKQDWPYRNRHRHAGLDVADTGADKNAAALRVGPVISWVEAWVAPTTWETGAIIDKMCMGHDATRMYYDGTGVGSGIRGYMALTRDRRTYASRPVNFGGSVTAPDKLFTYRMTNREMFSRRNAQMGWAVRMRAENTKRLLNGEQVSPDQCLFINPDIPDLEDYLLQLSQPEWKENAAGRIVIDKQPDDAPSPDKYDGTVLAFARDSAYGLTLHTRRNAEEEEPNAREFLEAVGKAQDEAKRRDMNEVPA